MKKNDEYIEISWLLHYVLFYIFTWLDRLFFKWIAKASGCNQAAEGVEHKLRYIFMEKLLCDPAYEQGNKQYADSKLSHAVITMLVFK